MFCTNCGKNIDEDSKFCQFCGGKIKNDITKELPKKDESTVEKHEEEDAAPANSSSKNIDNELLQEAKKAANNIMLQGIGWFILGLIITGVTYSAAGEGDTYYVLWGAMIVGVYMFLRGIYYKLFPSQLIQKAVEKQGEESNK
ncbi:MAG: zinc-ribbon domain-containing protein [Patescibacteria group bacterium]|jgi:hypothetical protein